MPGFAREILVPSTTARPEIELSGPHAFWVGLSTAINKVFLVAVISGLGYTTTIAIVHRTKISVATSQSSHASGRSLRKSDV